MHVLHLSSEYPPQFVYGLGRYVHELALAQIKLGLKVTVLTNSFGGDLENVVTDGVRVIRVFHPPPPKAPTVPAMLLHFNLQLVERCLSLAEEYKFDAINAHDWLTYPAAFHLARLLKIPLIATLHDIVFNKVRNREFNESDAYVAGIENWACHTAAKIVVLSQAVFDEAVHAYHAKPAHTHIVPAGIGIEPLAESDSNRICAWRSQLARDDEDLFLFAGRLDPEKGLDTLLKAAALLKDGESRPRWKLIVAGSGQLEEHLRTQINTLNLTQCVKLIGYLTQSELRIAYAASDVVVVPSEYEPFGLVPLEAQRVGTPVIVSATGGLAETLRQTRGGISFAPRDANSLCRAMKDMLNPQARQNFGRAGKEAVAKLFHWEDSAKTLSKIYDSALAFGPPKNLHIPSWTPIRKDLLNQAKTSAACANITVFWDPSRSATLKDILGTLSNAHALRSLNGMINVLSIISTDAHVDDDWNLSFDRTKFVKLKSEKDLTQYLVDSACVVAEGCFAEALINSGVLRPDTIPVIWLGNPNIPDARGWSVRNSKELHALANKLLCDDGLRNALAPNLFNKLQQTERNNQLSSQVILHILPQLVTGGAETTLLELLRHSTKLFEHKILSLGPVEGPLPAEFSALGVTISQIATDSVPEILNAIQKVNPAIIHLHSMSYIPAWISVHRHLARYLIVETEHVVNIGAGHFGPVNKVICVSHATKDAHNNYISIWRERAPRIGVIYNGIRLEDFAVGPTKCDARRRLNLPPSRPIIGRVSALARNKLPMEALEVIPKVLKRCPSALFVIVGDGPQRQAAEGWVRSKNLSDSVLFLGERRDLPQILPAFDVFAYYTTKDALGNVILEAVAAGVPVVTTRVEGTPEALAKAPGSLVELGQLEDFAEAVVKWINSPPSDRYRIEEKFSAPYMAKCYQETYHELLAQDSTRKHDSESKHINRTNATKLLIKFPTRGRPDKFFDVLDIYLGHLSGKHDVRVVVSCDLDDPLMNNAEVRKRFQHYPLVLVRFGSNSSKVQAVNADLEDQEFDILLLASDDMIPQCHGYDDLIVKEMNRHFPDADGVLFFNDGYRGAQLNTLVIQGKRYYERFGYIYHPDYKSLWCDNEFTDVANLLGKQVYLDRVIIKHEHPANTGAGLDPLYIQNDKPLDEDKQTYLRRKVASFGLNPSTRILFVLLGRLGDVLCGIPTYKALKRKHANASITWAVLPQYSSLIRTIADDVIAFGSEQDLFRCNLPDSFKEWDRVMLVQPSWHHHEWAQLGKPLIDFIAHKSGVELTRRQITLNISSASLSRAENLTTKLKPFIIINAGPHYSGPNWPIDQRSEIATLLKEKGFTIVALAGKDGHGLKGAVSFFDLPLDVSAALITHAELYIGQDCGTSWLACAAHNTPKIILLDKSCDRVGYDSYLDSLEDKNIVEFPLNTATTDIVAAALKIVKCAKHSADPEDI